MDRRESDSRSGALFASNFDFGNPTTYLPLCIQLLTPKKWYGQERFLNNAHQRLLRQQSSKKAECVKVVVRCRPLSEGEKAKGHQRWEENFYYVILVVTTSYLLRVVEMDVPRGVVTICDPQKNRSTDLRKFTFDAIYNWK